MKGMLKVEPNVGNHELESKLSFRSDNQGGVKKSEKQRWNRLNTENSQNLLNWISL